jgi:hypothetical protein
MLNSSPGEVLKKEEPGVRRVERQEPKKDPPRSDETPGFLTRYTAIEP